MKACATREAEHSFRLHQACWKIGKDMGPRIVAQADKARLPLSMHLPCCSMPTPLWLKQVSHLIGCHTCASHFLTPAAQV
jgi:hypothetical protein